jgi:hypothetical protein
MGVPGSEAEGEGAAGDHPAIEGAIGERAATGVVTGLTAGGATAVH